MRKSRLVLVFICSFLILQAFRVNAQSTEGAPTEKRVIRIEISGNTRSIFYDDGTKSVEANTSDGIGVTSTGTATVIGPLPPEIPWDKILRILKQILDGFFGGGSIGVILAWKIWQMVKTARRRLPVAS